MARFAPAVLSGFGLPDTRFAVSEIDTASVYADTGGNPGSFEPLDALSDLTIRASGAQSEALMVELRTSGMPGVGPRGARISSWTVTDGTRCGWNPPTWIDGWQALYFSTTAAFGYPSACVIPSTQEIVTVAWDDANNQGMSWVRSPWVTTNGVTGGAIPVATTCTSTQAWAVACAPRSERLIAVCNGAAIESHYSDDHGATWAVLSSYVAAAVLAPLAPLRSRLVVTTADDYCYLLAYDDGGTTRVSQYASSDGMSSATLVNTTAFGITPDVVALAGGGLGLVSIVSGDPTWQKVGSAYEVLATATATTIAAASLDEVCAWVDPHGSVYVAGRQFGNWYLWRSDDEGDTWTAYDCGPYASGENTTYLTSVAPVSAAGATWWVHQWAAGTATSDLSVGLARLGGWSSVTLDVDHASDVPLADPDAERLGFGPGTGTGSVVWLPFEKPGNDAAAWTVAGAGADTMNSAALHVTTAAAVKTYSAATIPAASAQVLAHFAVTPSGGSIATTTLGVRISSSNGATGATVDVRLTATQLYIYDVIGAVQLGSTVTRTTAAIEVLIGLQRTGALAVWYRLGATSRTSGVLYHEPRWILAYSGTASTSAAVVAAAVTWGHIASGTVTSDWTIAQAVWGSTCYSVGATDYAGVTAGSAPFVGARLSGMPFPGPEPAVDLATYSTAAASQTVVGATLLSAQDGPARYAEQHRAVPSYDHGLDKLDPAVSPSPLETWQNLSGVTTSLIWSMPQVTRPNSGSMFVAVRNSNIRSFNVQADPGTGVYATIGAYNAAIGFEAAGLKAAAVGDQVWPDATTTDGARYLQRDELAGGWVKVDATWYEIESNEEGSWTASASSTKQARITLKTSVGAAVTAKACVIVWPSGLLVIHDVANYAKIRINSVVVAPTAGDQIGQLLIGGLVVPGLPWDWGWTEADRLNATEMTSRGGTTRRREEGPISRVWTMAWPGGAPLGKLRSGVPDYVSGHASPIGTRNDVPWVLRGLLRQASSGEIPIVAIRSIPSTTTYTTLTDRTLWMVGRPAIGDLQWAQVTGGAGVKEYVRVEQLTVAELV